MRTETCCVIAMLVGASWAAAALAQSDKPWAGVYAGADLGGTGSATCANAALTGVSTDEVGGLSFSACPTSALVGGVQGGENFQTKRFVWGLGADLDIINVKRSSESLKSASGAFPSGTYTYSGRLSPSGLLMLGPRVGYAGDLLLPYLRAGGLTTVGGRNSSVSFTPAGTTKSTAPFSGGDNFSSTGWAAGGGSEIGLNGAWSISVDYLHLSFGGGAHATTSCSGGAAACSAFTDVALVSGHTGFHENMFRVGINHWFGYWDP
jgi:outer membrane immunogenic protein